MLSVVSVHVPGRVFTAALAALPFQVLLLTVAVLGVCAEADAHGVYDLRVPKLFQFASRRCFDGDWRENTRNSEESNGASGGARTRQAIYRQSANSLALTQIACRGKIAENAYTRPFEAKVGRKVVGKNELRIVRCHGGEGGTPPFRSEANQGFTVRLWRVENSPCIIVASM